MGRSIRDKRSATSATAFNLHYFMINSGHCGGTLKNSNGFGRYRTDHGLEVSD